MRELHCTIRLEKPLALLVIMHNLHPAIYQVRITFLNVITLSCFVLDSDIKPVRVPHCLKKSHTSVLVSRVIPENIHTIPQPAFWKSEGMGVNDYGVPRAWGIMQFGNSIGKGG